MNEINDHIKILQKYADLADSIGDYKSADECYKLLKEAQSYQNSNIKTAMVKTAFFKKLFRGVKNIGRGIDRFVRKNLGGWSTIAMIAAAPYLSKLAPQLKGIGKQIVDAVKGGKNPLDLLKSQNPLVAQLANNFMQTMQQTQAQPQQFPEQFAMQPGVAPGLQGYLPSMGGQMYGGATPAQQSYFNYSTDPAAFQQAMGGISASATPQSYSESAQAEKVFQDTFRLIQTNPKANPQQILQTYKTNMQNIVNTAKSKSQVPPGQQQTTPLEQAMPGYNTAIRNILPPQFKNLI